MSTTTRAVPAHPTRRALALLVALAVTVAGLVTVMASTASAAVTGSTTNASLTWGFSNGSTGWGISTTGHVTQVNPGTAPSPIGPSGSSFSNAEGFTLTDGTGTIAPDGTGTIDFTGSVTYSPFAGYGSLVTDKSTVTFADFELDVTSATRGTLTADVTYHKPTIDLTTPTRVEVANFDITSLSTSDGQFSLQTAAPDWTNVVPSGTYSAGYSDSWPTQLVNLLSPAVNGQDEVVYFYRTGNTAGNTNKAPLPISATADLATPSVTASVTAASPADGVTASVSGDGFSAVTNPGDAGIYVGIAPAGGLPDVSTQEGAAAFAAVAWVQPAALAGGTFTQTLTAPTASLDPSKTYSVYTWRAHSHSTTSQDTETPLAIDFAALKAPSTVAVSGLKATTAYGASRTATVSVSSDSATKPTGKVTAKLGTLKNGKASISLIRNLGVGTRKVVFTYPGDTNTRASSASTTLKVTKVNVKLAYKTTTKPTHKKKGKATVTVTPKVGGPASYGKVRVYFKKKHSTTKYTTKSFSTSKASITVPKLAKGTWKVYVKYYGTSRHNAVKSTYKGTLKVTK